MRALNVTDIDCKSLIGKKVKVTFFDKRVKVGILQYKLYGDISKYAFEVDEQRFHSCYVDSICEVEE